MFKNLIIIFYMHHQQLIRKIKQQLILFFIDQFVQISITANNRPGLLAAKWAGACAVAVSTLWVATPHLGGYAGPLAMALGLLAGWVVVAVGRGTGLARRRRPEV